MFCAFLGWGSPEGQRLLKEKPELLPYSQPMTAGHAGELGAKLDRIAEKLDRLIDLQERQLAQGSGR